MKVIIGVDPDSNKHGIAIYIDGTLSELKMLNTIQLYRYITNHHKQDKVVIHIEDVKRNKATWHACGRRVEVFGQASQRVGMCKQAQTSVEQMADELGIEVVLHRVSKMWKKGPQQKALFEKVTGWASRSNEDTRSAAWFGYQGIKCDAAHR